MNAGSGGPPSGRPPISVLHLITGLDRGGAEIMLAKLVSHPTLRLEHRVVSLTPPGPVAQEIAAAGVAVHSLDMARGAVDPRGLLRLAALLRRHRPQVLQSWLYHADLLGLVAGRLARVPHIVWNLRCSDMDMRHYSRLSRALPRILARLSRMPALCIVNSEAGRAFHEGLGYRPRRWEMIPNGFDLDVFKPDPASRAEARRELGVDDGTRLIGLPARVDPMKDHDTFMTAARLVGRRDDVRFVLIGDGTEAENARFSARLRAADVADRVIRLGRRSDMPRIYRALDIVTLSSAFGEGFPNVLGEAMASAALCVATDVGDSRLILGDTGRIVPPRDPAALAAGWMDLLDRSAAERQALGARARARVAERYGLDRVAARYEALYDELT